MKKTNIATILFGLAAAVLTSCGDVADEITSSLFGRNFSPIDFESKNIGEEKASLTWKASDGATSYVVELFEDDSLSFEGEADRTIETTATGVNLEGLVYDTRYSARIKALSADDESRTSKWNGITFKTNAKQFMKSLKESDVADRSVIITWEAEEGYDVSTIVIGNITHEITAEEKAAGRALIEGLEPETSYTAYLYYNGKQCGNRSFTTIADLNGATLVHEGDNLKDLLENARDGETFAIFGGTYVISTGEEGSNAAGSVKITKSIIIKGVYPTSQPVINGRFEIHDGASLTINQVVLDGTNTSGDQCFNFKTVDAAYGVLDIQNTEIKNYTKGVFYLNVASTVEGITFNNCLIHDIVCDGGDMFDSRAGYYKSLTLSNSTIYNSNASRDFIRMDDKSAAFPGVTGPVIKVDHCTLYNVLNGKADKRLLYVRFAGNEVIFTNNIVSGFNGKRGFTDQGSTDSEPDLSNNYYHNTVNLVSASADAKGKWYDENGTVLDENPFKEAEKGNFTLNPDSEAAKNKAGDPRWIK